MQLSPALRPFCGWFRDNNLFTLESIRNMTKDTYDLCTERIKSESQVAALQLDAIMSGAFVWALHHRPTLVTVVESVGVVG